MTRLRGKARRAHGPEARLALRLAAPALLLAIALAGCSLPPLDSERVELRSATFGFVDELGRKPARGSQPVAASLLLPPPEAGTLPPLPAVVLLHSSVGQGSQDWHVAGRLTEAGYAVLAIDSFGSRGVEKTVEDQTLVSTSSMLADAYAGLARLADDPRIDPQRIAVVGFSKGGMAALYAALETVRDHLVPAAPGEGGPRFAAHVAYYPWCGLRFLERRTTGAPLLLQLGGRDEIAPAALCQALVDDLRRADPAARIEVALHPEARHAFDHPLLEWFGQLPVSAPVPVDCRFEERRSGRFVETLSGRPATAATLPELFAGCARGGLVAGGDPDAAEAALARTLDFLGRSLDH